MLKKELEVALVVIGAAIPLFVNADSMQKMHPGYNQAANYEIENGVAINITADYLYWKLSEDMSPVAALLKVTTLESSAVFNGTGKSVLLDPTYKTGFQIGAGLGLKGMDDWTLYAEYTWHQNKTDTSVKAGSGELLVIDPSITPRRYGALVATDLDASFRLHYNAVDLSLQRTFYNGKKLTTLFGMGLRGLFVSQKYDVHTSGLSYFETGDPVLIPEPGFFDARQKLKSWALGPRFSLEGNWLLGLGFRARGDLAASILYTRYTTEEAASISILTHLLVSEASNHNTLRAVTETSLGIGWGAYLGEDKGCHFDLSASYEFNVFWNQGIASMNGGSGNFYLQGLNVAARIDF